MGRGLEEVLDQPVPRQHVGVESGDAAAGEQIVVDFRGASLPEELVRRLDVTDFATPVVTVDALRAGDNARLVINANGAFEQLAYQSDEVFSIEIREAVVVTDAPSAYGEGRNYMGERLTLNFQDIEVRAVLQLLADMSDMNIVVSDTVQGNVTLRLQNVPWDQALDIVLQTKGLDMRQRDNVIIVAPAAEIATRERQALEARREIETLLGTRVFLDLRVRVEKDWQQRPGMIERLGL